MLEQPDMWNRTFQKISQIEDVCRWKQTVLNRKQWRHQVRRAQISAQYVVLRSELEGKKKSL